MHKDNKQQSWLLIAVGFFLSLSPAVAPFFVVPHFKNVFSTLGADLPIFTLLVCEHPYIFFLIPLFVLALGFLWPKPKSRAIVACVVGATSPLWGGGLLAFILYLPIFQLSSTM
jgi:hypothetical protein